MLNSKYNLFLSGGGSENDSAKLDREFLKSFSGSKILYIPIAMPEHVITYESCYDWISTSLTKLTNRFLEIYMCTSPADLSSELLKKYDAVYIGGGNTYKLLQDLQDSNFINILREYINAGGVYYGGSAGAIITGINISIVSEENDNGYKYNKALNFLSGHAVRCHYNGTQDDQINKFICLYNSPVIVLPEKTGVHCFSGKCKVIGFESAYLFNGHKKIEYPVNSIINL